MISSSFNFIQGCLLHQRGNYKFKLVKWHKLLLLHGSPWDKTGCDAQSYLPQNRERCFLSQKASDGSPLPTE